MKNFAEPNSPLPSPEARELVRGASDLHVHPGPDLLPRSAVEANKKGMQLVATSRLGSHKFGV
jgi:hypothetical protein